MLCASTWFYIVIFSTVTNGKMFMTHNRRTLSHTQTRHIEPIMFLSSMENGFKNLPYDDVGKNSNKR